MSFRSLGLEEYLLSAVEKAGYESPTPIQEQAIPLVMAGCDLMAQAQTGTGKTAAFALPVIQNCVENDSDSGEVAVLVLTPTRELARQVAASFRSYGLFTPRKLKVVALIGGESINDQLDQIDRGTDIVVATPGRLIDFIERGAVNLHACSVLILDEADKLLDEGFAEELDTLLEALPAQRQNLLFSATFPDKVVTLSKRLLCSPLEISVDAEPTVELIDQRVIEVNRENRGQLLRHLIKTESWDHTIVFTATCRGAANLTKKLRLAGVNAGALHGDLPQAERNDVLDQFCRRKISVMVATDIACRGLDVSRISHVVNYDLPRSPEDYIHRIGRTARAGESGQAISFIGHEDMAHFKLIEKRAGINLDRTQIESFELIGEPSENQKGGAPVKGKRKSKKDKLREAAAKAEKH